MEDLILNHAKLPAAVDGAVGRRHHGMHALHSAYVQHLLGSIDCDLTGLRVLVDCANGAASATAPDLFRALPLQADFIHTEPDGVNINNGCGSTHLESLAGGVVSGGYDLGIAFDGDADRCLLVDEQGEYHRRRQGHGRLRLRAQAPGEALRQHRGGHRYVQPWPA